MASETLNMDLASLVRYIDRYILELANSTSSGTTDWRDADINRLKAYLEAIKMRKQAIFEQPQLDCPKTNRVAYVINDCPVIPAMDNDNVRDVCEILVMIREELAQAPGSVNIPNGLAAPDAARFDVYIQKLEQYISTFLEPVEPIDLPETSPQAPPT